MLQHVSPISIGGGELPGETARRTRRPFQPPITRAVPRLQAATHPVGAGQAGNPAGLAEPGHLPPVSPALPPITIIGRDGAAHTPFAMANAMPRRPAPGIMKSARKRDCSRPRDINLGL